MTTTITAIIAWMLATYAANTAADEYWFGFVLNHIVYVVPHLTLSDLVPFLKADRASTAKGGFAKLRIRATVPMLTALLPRAIALGDESILTAHMKNKGDGFEKVIVETFTADKWAKNSVPFFMDGDATIAGKKVQIKLNGAELTNEKILKRYFAA